MLRAEKSDDSLPFIRPRMSRLPSPSPVYRILFVCLGNICRSPAAEIICRDILQRCGVQAQVDSCGTASYHVGSRPDVRMLSALRRAGYEYAGHRARTLCSKDGELFDFIIPQDAENERDVLRIISPSAAARVLPMSRWFPAGCKYREVPDPYYGAYPGQPRGSGEQCPLPCVAMQFRVGHIPIVSRVWDLRAPLAPPLCVSC